MPRAMRRSAASIASWTSGRKLRVVPPSVAVSGMTLVVKPALNWVTLTTAAFIGSVARATMRCSATTISAPTSSGSMA